MYEVNQYRSTNIFVDTSQFDNIVDPNTDITSRYTNYTDPNILLFD
jgi:hypothetical protein